MAEEEGMEVVFVGPAARWENGSGPTFVDDRLTTIMGAAYLSGLPKARVTCSNGGLFEVTFDFLAMKQAICPPESVLMARGLGPATGEEHSICPPEGLLPPASPCIPPGPAVCILAPPTSVGKTVRVQHPVATGQHLSVRVPDSVLPIPPLPLSGYAYHVDLTYHDWLWLLVPLHGFEADEGAFRGVGQGSLLEVGQDASTQAAPNEWMEVHIVRPSGSQLASIRCTAQETTSKVKERLEIMAGVQAQLLHEGNVLADDATLQQAGIRSGVSLTLLYHDPLLELLPFHVFSKRSPQSEPESKMWMLAGISEPLPGDLILPGVQVMLNNFTGAVIDHDIWNERGDIGIFGTVVESIGSEFLLGKPASRTDAERVVEALRGDPRGVFESYDQAVLLSGQCCRQLRSLLDSQCHQGKDVQITLPWIDLATFVGQSALIQLAELFNDRVDRIKLRRVEARGEFISFHLDHSQKTMQVPLNDEDEYCGGRLAYLTSRGLQIPARPRGSATIHDNAIVHGVTQMKSGVRYSLFRQKLHP